MQNNESVPDQSHTSAAVNSSSWQRAAIVVVITALIAGTGGYLLGLRMAQKPSRGNQEITLRTSPTLTREFSPSPKPSPIVFVPKTYYAVPATNPELTANWKTYTSEKYEFSFRYPSDRYADLMPYPTVMQGIYPDDLVLYAKQLPPGAKGKSAEELGPLFNEIHGGSLWFAFRDEGNVDVFFSDETQDLAHGFDNDYKDEGIVIGGKTGRIISGVIVSLIEPKITGPRIHFARNIDIPLKGKKHFIIKYYENAISLNEFNQILSTFKFTDQN